MSVRNLTISVGAVAAAFVTLFLVFSLYCQKRLGDYAELTDSASRLGSSLNRTVLLLDGPDPKELAEEIKTTDLLFDSVQKGLSNTWIQRDKDPALAAGFARASAEWKEASSKLRNHFRGGDEGLKKRLLSLSGEVLSLSSLIKEDTLAFAGRYTKAVVIFSMASIGGIWCAALFMIFRILAPMEEAIKNLNESRAHYSDLVNTIPDALAETDEHGNITFVNEAVKALTGYSEKDLIGKDHSGFIPGGAAAEMREIFDAVMRGETLKDRELPIILKDGSTRYFEFSSSPIRTEAGKVAGCRFVGRDIDDRKRITDELKKIRKESDEASGKLKRTVEDLEEFALLAVRRELKMHEIRERFKKLLEERQR